MMPAIVILILGHPLAFVAAPLRPGPVVATAMREEKPTGDAATQATDEAKKAAEDKRKAAAAAAIEHLKKQHRVAKLSRDLDVARRQVGKSELAVEHQKAESAAALSRADEELRLAERKLAKLKDKDTPQRLAEARLGLRGAEDYLRESEEELAQLEMMYKETDLADKTREIVLNRGKRRLERARTGLANQQNAINILEQQSLPIETSELLSQVEQKKQGIESAKRAAQFAALEKDMGVIGAKLEVTRLEEELDEARKEEAEAARAAK